jgi:hypothetical protein
VPARAAGGDKNESKRSDRGPRGPRQDDLTERCRRRCGFRFPPSDEHPQSACDDTGVIACAKGEYGISRRHQQRQRNKHPTRYSSRDQHVPPSAVKKLSPEAKPNILPILQAILQQLMKIWAGKLVNAEPLTL